MISSKRLKPDNALILAAGLGTRLWPITDTTPKCLVKVIGQEMLARTIDRVEKFVSKIYVNTHYLHQKVEEFVESHPLKCKLVTLYEPDLLGTGGTVKNLSKLYDIETLLVHNADAYFDQNEFLDDFITKYKGEDIYLALYPKAHLSFEEKGDFDINVGKALYHKGGEYVYTGLGIFNTKQFVGYEQDQFTLVDLINRCPQLSIGYYIMNAGINWVDIGTHEKLNSLNNAPRQLYDINNIFNTI